MHGTFDQPWIDVGKSRETAENTSILLIADHASNHVPAGIDLGIAPHLLNTHIAIDLGVAALGTALCTLLGCAGILGGVSRLVIDLNREEDAPHLIPLASDGHAVPGNMIDHAGRTERIDRYWRPYHDHVASVIAQDRPKLLISLHSFTPALETQPDVARPWQVGVLYNDDDRAARRAIPALQAAGIIVGDQLPYSGKLLNATMNRHAEGNGIAYLGLEMRQDLIRDEADVSRWADLLSTVIEAVMEKML
jgi:predicted N-formylglutamate amidohydrolase